jgi:hypothetical protein
MLRCRSAEILILPLHGFNRRVGGIDLALCCLRRDGAGRRSNNDKGESASDNSPPSQPGGAGGRIIHHAMSDSLALLPRASVRRTIRVLHQFRPALSNPLVLPHEE